MSSRRAAAAVAGRGQPPRAPATGGGARGPAAVRCRRRAARCSGGRRARALTAGRAADVQEQRARVVDWRALRSGLRGGCRSGGGGARRCAARRGPRQAGANLKRARRRRLGPGPLFAALPFLAGLPGLGLGVQTLDPSPSPHWPRLSAEAPWPCRRPWPPPLPQSSPCPHVAVLRPCKQHVVRYAGERAATAALGRRGRQAQRLILAAAGEGGAPAAGRGVGAAVEGRPRHCGG
jgi:hypothetical protein